MTRSWSRRRLIGAALGTASVLHNAAKAQEAELSDRGIGGTGVVPTDPDDSDRGIGGTGVVGTIRRFGSIVVNDLRITFPRSVPVRIDGRPAHLADLRIGHVAHVLAAPEGSHLATRRIEIFSEVVGPVEAHAPDGFTVLGQRVIVPDAKGPRTWRRHRWVAVSGLRRLDGTIVASRVERRSPKVAQVFGVPQRDPDGIVRVGALPVDGLDGDAVGRRMRLVGALVGGRFVLSQAPTHWIDLLESRPDRLSIESYVALDTSGLPMGVGATLGNGGSPDGSDPGERAVVSASLRPDGQIHVEGVRVETNAHDGPMGRSRPGGQPGSRPVRDPEAMGRETDHRGAFGSRPGFGPPGGLEPGGQGGGPMGHGFGAPGGAGPGRGPGGGPGGHGGGPGGGGHR